MNIRRIGNYRIITGNDFKQIYSKTRMLQISNDKTYYVDIEKGKILKMGIRVLKWLRKDGKNEYIG
jgi:hypothetical protein